MAMLDHSLSFVPPEMPLTTDRHSSRDKLANVDRVLGICQIIYLADNAQYLI